MNDTNVNVPVLVIADPADSTANLVVAELDRRGVASLRVSLAGEPHPVGLMAQMNTWARRWDGFLQWDAARVDLPAVTAVYYLPDPSALAPTAAADCGADVVCELRAALPGARWLNDPVAVRENQRHARQLSAATASGLAVPYAYVTNLEPALMVCADPEAFQAIADAGGKVTTTETRFFQERLDADTAHLTLVGDTRVGGRSPEHGPRGRERARRPHSRPRLHPRSLPDGPRPSRSRVRRVRLRPARRRVDLPGTPHRQHLVRTPDTGDTDRDPIATYLAEAAPAASGILPMGTSS